MGQVRINETTVQQMAEYGKYCDVLYSFTKTVLKINDEAAEGEKLKRLQSQCTKLLPAYTLLCGGSEISLPEVRPNSKTVLQVNMQVRDGWGLCPKCGGKCIKTKEDTVLVNFPMYCKHCKRESVVTWEVKK